MKIKMRKNSLVASLCKVIYFFLSFSIFDWSGPFYLLWYDIYSNFQMVERKVVWLTCLGLMYFCLQTASSLACAQKGWVSVDLDKIQCEYCGSSLHYSPPQHQLNQPQGHFFCYCNRTLTYLVPPIWSITHLLPMNKSFFVCLGGGRILCRCDLFS